MFKSPLARSVATLLLLLALVSPVGALTVTTLDCSIPTVTSSIAIGVTQVEWLFTLDVNPSSGSILPRSVYLTAPVAWTFSYTALGTQYPVVANALMRIDLTAASTTFFVTGASSSTLSLYATPIGPTVSATAVSGATIDASVIGGTSPAAGTFTTVAASAAGGATLGTDVAGGTTNIPGFLKMWSNGDNAFFSSFTAATQTASAAYTLPTAAATVAGQVLTDAAANGVLSWATPAGGGITGTLTATRIPVASGASTLTDYSTLTTDGANITLNGITIGRGIANQVTNTVMGTSALNDVGAGGNMSVFGYHAGQNAAGDTDTTSTYFGAYADQNGVGQRTNSGGFGYQATVTASNQIVLGNGSVTDLKSAATFHPTAGSAASASAMSFGVSLAEGLQLKVIEETVTFTASTFKALTTALPNGAVVVCAQATIKTTVVAGGTGVKIALGQNGGTVNIYGSTDDLTANQKITSPLFPNGVIPLVGAQQIDVNIVDTAGVAMSDSNGTDGVVRVRIYYWLPVALDN